MLQCTVTEIRNSQRPQQKLFSFWLATSEFYGNDRIQHPTDVVEVEADHHQSSCMFSVPW